MALGPLEFELLRSVLGAFFLASGLPDVAYNACRCGDRRLDFMRKLVNVTRQMAGLPDTADFGWRPGDAETIMALKIFRALGGTCVCNFTLWSLWLDILEQARLNAGLPDLAEFAFRTGDTRLIVLAKLLNVLNNTLTPPVPPVDLCCIPIGSYGLLTDPVTETCDWGFVYETADCNDDFGTLV